MKRSTLPTLRLLTVATLLLFAMREASADRTWTGADDTDFENGANWEVGAPADDTTTDIARFTGTPTANQPLLTSSRKVKGIYISGSSGWELFASGPAYELELGPSGIEVQSANNTTQTNGSAVVYKITEPTYIGARGHLRFFNKFTGPGGLNFAGIQRDNNQKEFRLYAASDFTGDVNIGEFAKVAIYHPDALGINNSRITIWSYALNMSDSYLDLRPQSGSLGLNANKIVQLGHDNGTPEDSSDDIGGGIVRLLSGTELASAIEVYGRSAVNGNHIVLNQLSVTGGGGGQ